MILLENKPWQACPHRLPFCILRGPCIIKALINRGVRYISNRMTRIVDMDDRARVPWRFFGADLVGIARL